MSSSQFAEFTQPGQKPVVNSIFDFSAEALGQLRLWLEQNPPAIGISNILGFSQFTAQTATVVTLETTSSTGYTDMATVGPTLTGLPDGQYVILYGCAGFSATAANFASVQANGVAATDADSCTVNSVNAISISRGVIKSLSNSGSNTVTMKYKSDRAASVSFQNRWLIALRYANS